MMGLSWKDEFKDFASAEGGINRNPGDRVEIAYTEALAISVEKAKKK